jgi:hypothetical protein
LPKISSLREEDGEILSYIYIRLYGMPPLLSGSNQIDFPRHIKKNPQIYTFHENSSSAIRAVPCGQTYKHDEANSLFRNFAKAPNDCTVEGLVTQFVGFVQVLVFSRRC